MEQDYIKAYRLILEVADIQLQADTLEKGLAMQQWIKKATTLVSEINLSCSQPALNLVQTESRQPLQNYDDANRLA